MHPAVLREHLACCFLMQCTTLDQLSQQRLINSTHWDIQKDSYNRLLVSAITSSRRAHLTNSRPVQAGLAVVLQLQFQGEVTLQCLSLFEGELQAIYHSFTTLASSAS